MTARADMANRHHQALVAWEAKSKTIEPYAPTVGRLALGSAASAAPASSYASWSAAVYPLEVQK